MINIIEGLQKQKVYQFFEPSKKKVINLILIQFREFILFERICKELHPNFKVTKKYFENYRTNIQSFNKIFMKQLGRKNR